MIRQLLLIIVCCLPCYLSAQNRTITGNITDEESGEPIIGATVLLTGTGNGTITDPDGNYILQVPATSGSITFSFIGYETQQIVIGTSNNMNVAMKTANQLLEELVVVGYGTEIKSQLTGSVSQVKSEDIALTPVSTVEQTLQGKVAGVFIESNNGKVGSSVRLRIRGSSSINANNEPLYVVDGIPINTASVNDGDYVYLNPLNDIDFNDIASIEVLKDASASAIYGSRGANGVVIITTKRGKKGDTKITLDFQYGFSKPTRLREFMNGEQYLSYYTEAAINAGIYDYANGISGFDSEEEAIDDYLRDVDRKFKKLDGYSDYTTDEINTDWQSLAFQTAVSQAADISISGGSDKFQYFTSYGYSSQDGILIGNHGDRVNVLFNLDAQLTERLTMGLSTSFSRSINNDIPDDNSFSTPLQIVAEPGFAPVTDTATGEYYTAPDLLYYNPLIEIGNGISEITTFRTIGNIFAEYELYSGLSLRGEIGGDITNLSQYRFAGSKTDAGQSVGGYGENYNARVENYDMKLLLLYEKQIHEMHNLNITAGTEYQSYDDFVSAVEGQGFPNDKLQTIASAAEIVYGYGALDYYKFLSYFGRATYSFDDKYLFTFTGRFDGSSRFGEVNRYGFFPSVSAGWIITEEEFFENSTTLSFLKVRASYGITGNAGIGNFVYKGTYGVSAYAGTSALYPNTIANPDLTWEKTAQIDAGIDFGFFKDRINGTVDYYLKNTSDLLLDVPLPATTGFTVQTQNVGKLENKGIEIVLNSDNFVRTFKWNTSFNIAFNENVITELSEGQTLIDYGGSDYMNVVMVGQPLGAFYGAEYAGVNPDNGDGLFYVNDVEGSEETTTDFNQANYVILGDPNPDFIAGITNTFSYKGVDLEFTFQSVYGNQIHLAGDYWMSSNASQWDNQTVDQLDAWQNPGDITDVPEARLLFDNGTQSRSSRYLSDGSYLRLKTCTLGYTFSKKVMRQLKMDNLRVYLSSYNLLTFTKYRGWDPEVSADSFVDNVYYGIDFYSAPQPKTLVMGISIGI
ncbi:MAG: TonB-dependent receptor [Chitinophagales bacterium]|nr:TonB-dependent receptor [Chitinophagales bacterium]